jgi:ankyrin repeat protein
LAKEKNNTSMVRVLLAARDSCRAGIDASRVGPAQTDSDGSDCGLLSPAASHQEGEAPLALVSSGDNVQGGQVDQTEAKRSGSDAGVTQRSSTTAEAQRLHNACKNGDHSVVSRLLAAGVHPNTSCFGVTPLYVAAMAGRERIVSLLIEYKVDVDCLTLTGSRPLAGAARMGNLRIVELLLDAGGDVNLASSRGITPLMVAASLPMLKLLLARGALLDLVDVNGCTALLHAAQGRSPGSISLLLDAGADASLRDAQGARKHSTRCGQTQELCVSSPTSECSPWEPSTGRPLCAQTYHSRGRGGIWERFSTIR